MGGQVVMVLVSHKWRGLDSIPGHHSRVGGRDMTQPSALQDKVMVQFPVKDKLSWEEAGAEGTKKQRAEAGAEAGPRLACMTQCSGLPTQRCTWTGCGPAYQSQPACCYLTQPLLKLCQLMHTLGTWRFLTLCHILQ